MDRYGKYFLQHSLILEDDFCDYYVQDPSWGHNEILDVEHVVFFFREDAEDWIIQCANWDTNSTIRSLRCFLANDCLTRYMVHRMNDRQVILAVARELSMTAARIVIKPKLGWAVSIDPEYQEPVKPVAVEGAPDIGDMFDALQVELNTVVAEQKRSYDQWEARLAKMSDAEKAALYGKKSGGTLFDATIGAGLDLIMMSATLLWMVHLSQAPGRHQRPGNAHRIVGAVSKGDPFQNQPFGPHRRTDPALYIYGRGAAQRGCDLRHAAGFCHTILG